VAWDGVVTSLFIGNEQGVMPMIFAPAVSTRFFLRRLGRAFVNRLMEPVSMSKNDEQLCVRIAQVTRGKKLSDSSKARIYAALRAAAGIGKWRG
jgi:hypothetical protein